MIGRAPPGSPEAGRRLAQVLSSCCPSLPLAGPARGGCVYLGLTLYKIHAQQSPAPLGRIHHYLGIGQLEQVWWPGGRRKEDQRHQGPGYLFSREHTCPSPGPSLGAGEVQAGGLGRTALCPGAASPWAHPGCRLRASAQTTLGALLTSRLTLSNQARAPCCPSPHGENFMPPAKVSHAERSFPARCHMQREGANPSFPTGFCDSLLCR